MDQPKIPTLKDSQKPQVKVRGLGAGLSLMDRMKQFKKKDLAFILAGLGTLFMAPLAEHFMMSPDNGDASSGALGPGGGPGGNGNGIFGADRGGGSGDGTAPGGPAGSGGSDVITPLNVRDPSALIMGPGSSQQPQVGSAAPAVQPPVTAPSGHNDSDVRDALAASAVHAANSALGKTPLPMPKIGLSNNSLRGLGVVSGGSSATAGGAGGLAAPGTANFGRSGPGSNMAPIKGGGNIAAVTRGPGQGNNALDALKAKSGEIFDRSNLATNAGNQGNSPSIGNSGGLGSGQGNGGTGANDKAPGGSNAKQNKSDGTSLAYELMKQNLQKQLELYWKEKEAMDPTLELYKIRNAFAESLATNFASALGSAFITPAANAVFCGVTGLQSYNSNCSATSIYSCVDSVTGLGVGISSTLVGNCGGGTQPGAQNGGATTQNQWQPDGNGGLKPCASAPVGSNPLKSCNNKPTATGTGNNTGAPGATQVGGGGDHGAAIASIAAPAAPSK